MEGIVNKKSKSKEKQIKTPNLESMERLAQIMTDSPSLAKLANTEWEIRALKPAVNWQIAKIACEINKVENANYGDILKELSYNIPSVAKIITLALLNDKKRIEEEFDTVYETIMWESNPQEWGQLLLEILQLQDVGFFFHLTQTIELFKQAALMRRTTTKEQRSL